MILVTGGCGFIGAALVRRLLAEEQRVLVVDNFHSGGPDRLPRDSGLEIVEADVRDSNRIGEVFRLSRPAEVIHLAALHFIPYCDEHPLETLEVNAQGTRNVVEAGIQVNVTRILFTSSAAIYPISNGPSPEITQARPVEIYGYSKWMAEAILELRCGANQLAGVALRLFNTYGPGETNPHVIPHVIEQIRAGGPIHLGNLESRRDYIFIEDAVEAIVRLRAVRTHGYSVYNVGSGSTHSVREIVGVFEDLLGRALDVRSEPDLVRRMDRPNLCADPATLERHIHWKPGTTLREGISKLLESEGLL